VKSPDLPVIFAQIGTTTEPEIFINWEIVKKQQFAVQLPYVAMITTDDLALRDSVHFTPESYTEIGNRFATAYLTLIEKKFSWEKHVIHQSFSLMIVWCQNKWERLGEKLRESFRVFSKQNYIPFATTNAVYAAVLGFFV